MSEPSRFEKRMRVAILVALLTIVVVAPLIGVYAISPFAFAYVLQPYQLAVAVSVMLAQAIAVAALAWLVIRSRK